MRKAPLKKYATVFPGIGTMITMASVSVLPSLIIGAVSVVVVSKYWWMGFPAGWFLGFGVAMVADWVTLFTRVRHGARGATPTA